MKILYIVSTLKRVGPTNQLFYIIKHLEKSFEVKVLTLSPEPKDTLKQMYLDADIDVTSLNLSRIKGFFFAGRKVAELAKNYSPNIIHSQGLRADAISAKYLKKYKRIATLRNFPFYDYMMAYGKIKGWFIAQKHIRYLRTLEKFVVVSRAVSKEFKNSLAIDIDYIQNGVDINKFTKVDFNIKKKLRKSLNLPLKTKIFISVGNLNIGKDPLFILNSIKKFKINIFVIFLGSGHLKKQCIECSKNDSRFLFKGNVNNVIDYLQASDYFVSASKAEGLPNAVMEALACGLPSILSDIEPHKEFVIKKESESIKLYDTNNSVDFTRNIYDVLKEDYIKQSDDAVDIINENFTAKKMSMKYQCLYEEIRLEATT